MWIHSFRKLTPKDRHLGLPLRPIDLRSQLSQLHQPCPLAQLQHLHKQLCQVGQVLLAKRRKRLVIRMRAGRQLAERGVLISRPLDPAFNITLHTLRQTFGSWLAVEGVPLRAIQKLMGHKSITTTERYAHLSGENLGTAVERIERLLPKSLPSVAKGNGNGHSQAFVTVRKEWCGGRESNPHSPCGPRDFKSLASTSSATPARRVHRPCYHDLGALVEPLFPGAARGPIELEGGSAYRIRDAAIPVRNAVVTHSDMERSFHP